MKAPYALALAALAVLAPGLAAAQSRTASCAEHVTPVSSAVKGAHANANSFAPQGKPGPKVYGQPIQQPIFHKRKSRKPKPPA